MAELPRDELEDEVFWEGIEFSGTDLSGRSAAILEAAGCRFARVGLSAVQLTRALFTDCRFEGCDLANLRAEDSTLRRVHLTDSRATGLQWVNGGMRDVTFTECRLDLSSFRCSKCTKVRFERCDLRRVDFAMADLRGVQFVECDLTGAQFSRTMMSGSRLSGCVLADIVGVPDLAGATIDGSDLLALTYLFAEALGIKVSVDPAG